MVSGLMKTEKQWQQIQVMDQHKCEISVLHSNTFTTSIHLTNKNVKVNLKEYFVVKINYRNLSVKCITVPAPCNCAGAVSTKAI